jgi:hypothetical protein
MVGPLETAGFWNQVFVTIGCPLRIKDGTYVTSELGALMARALWCMCNGKEWSDDMEVTHDEPQSPRSLRPRSKTLC